MVRMKLLLAIAAARLAVGQDVDFFYTETVDLCQIDSASMHADEQSTHGGVCAYRADVARVYACPAPDPTCWTWYEDCNDSNIGQTVCNRAGSAWCCNAVAGETCTTTNGQINVCISNFTSPNSGVSVETANQNYLSALGVSNITATSQTADPIPFSTRQLAATSLVSSASTSTLPASTTATGTTTAGSASFGTGSATAGAASAASAPLTASDSSSGISGGAIAGIVIGAVAVLAIIGSAFFLLGRRRKSKTTKDTSGYNEMPTPPASQSAYTSSNEKARYGGPANTQDQPHVSELGSEGHGRAEMPNYPAHGPPPARYEMA